MPDNGYDSITTYGYERSLLMTIFDIRVNKIHSGQTGRETYQK